jgi:hypothetical protein
MPRNKKSKIVVKDPTPLQKIVLSDEFDAFIICVIIISAVFIASDIPSRPGSPTYVVYGNWFFNVSILHVSFPAETSHLRLPL